MAHVDGVEERALRDVSLLRGHVRCAQAVTALQHLAWDSRCRRTGRGSRQRRGRKGLSTIASCSRLEIRTGPTPTRSARIPTYKYSTFTVLCIQAPVAATCTCVVVILQLVTSSTRQKGGTPTSPAAQIIFVVMYVTHPPAMAVSGASLRAPTRPVNFAPSYLDLNRTNLIAPLRAFLKHDGDLLNF